MRGNEWENKVKGDKGKRGKEMKQKHQLGVSRREKQEAERVVNQISWCRGHDHELGLMQPKQQQTDRNIHPSCCAIYEMCFID